MDLDTERASIIHCVMLCNFNSCSKNNCDDKNVWHVVQTYSSFWLISREVTVTVGRRFVRCVDNERINDLARPRRIRSKIDWTRNVSANNVTR